MKQKQIYFLIALFPLGLSSFLSPTYARAFSVPNHELITKLAVVQVNLCRAEEHKTALPAEVTRLLAGCNAQQDGLWSKVALWHFHAPDRSLSRRVLPPGFRPVHTKLDPWFSALTGALTPLAASESGSYAVLGAILHYLQDVAVPAHVVPVFHPSLHGLSDSFDEYEVALDAASIRKRLQNRTGVCERLRSASLQTFKTLLDTTADATRLAIQATVPATLKPEQLSADRALTWGRLFWDASVRSEHGFGLYGVLGNQFGESSAVPSGAYAKFAEEQHWAAIEVSAAAIMKVSAAFEHPIGEVEDVACPVPSRCSGRLCPPSVR